MGGKSQSPSGNPSVQMDDTVAAVPSPNASFKVQLIGVVSYGVFTLFTCFVLWFVIKTVIGIRADKEDEEYGLDMSELGAVSFPDFTKK